MGTRGLGSPACEYLCDLLSVCRGPNNHQKEVVVVLTNPTLVTPHDRFHTPVISKEKSTNSTSSLDPREKNARPHPLLSPDEIKRESPEIDLSTPPPYIPGTQPPRFRASKQNAPPRSHPEHESSISVRSEFRRIHGRRVRVLTFGRIQQVPTSPRGVKRPHSDAFPLTEATTTGLAKKTGPRHSLLPLLL